MFEQTKRPSGGRSSSGTGCRPRSDQATLPPRSWRQAQPQVRVARVIPLRVGTGGDPRQPPAEGFGLRYDFRVAGNLVERLDAAVGDCIDGLVRAHHRRRLRRIGWAHAFESSDGWAGGDPPQRSGNAVELLVDGASFLPRLAEELERAQSYVHIAGWYLSTQLALVREGRRVVLLELLAELAGRVDVRVLLWAGAPLPLFRPSRADVRVLAERLRSVGVEVALDANERPLHCHHEK